jgi:hypothetical protein
MTDDSAIEILDDEQSVVIHHVRWFESAFGERTEPGFRWTCGP